MAIQCVKCNFYDFENDICKRFCMILFHDYERCNYFKEKENINDKQRICSNG